MKKIILSFLTIAFFGLGLNAQNVNIPDANFKAYLVGNTSININADAEISVGEATNFTGPIACNALSISDLTGIEAFTGNISLDAQSNLLTSLDLSANTGLSGTVWLNSNNLSSLIMPTSSAVTSLYVNNNYSLSSIDISGLTNLDVLMLINDNLTTLDVSNNTLLTTLNVGGNPFTSIDLTGLTSLTSIACQETGLLTLDLSPCTALYNFYAPTMADITTLNMANGNNMSFGPGSIDVTGAPNLMCVTVDNVTFSNTVWPPYFDAGISFSLNCGQGGGNILATGLTANGFGGASTVPVGSTLQMGAVITPANATSQVVLWQVVNGTGSATIDMNTGLLTGVSVGMVTVGATTVDGSNVYGTIDIEVIQQVGLTDLNKNNMTIYPNPVNELLTIDTDQTIQEFKIFAISGKMVQSGTSSSFSVEQLEAGIYILNVITESGMVQKRFIKN